MKEMKQIKKLATLVLALVMCFAMGMTAFAADATTKLTVEGDSSESFKGYLLMTATNSGDKYAYTVNAKYSSILQTAANKTSDADVIAYISGLDADGMRTFADKTYRAILKNKLGEDKAFKGGTIADVKQGYWLIADVTNVDAKEGAANSMVMIKTAGETAVTFKTKKETPKVEKKVKDVDDTKGTTSGWQDNAEFDVGDEMDFQLTGTVASNISSYKSYYYEFHDTMTNMTYVAKSYTVQIDGQTVTSSFTPSWDASTKKLSFKCENILSISGVNVTKDSKVVVTYKATLDESAVVGTNGNPNTVYLQYSNNPYSDEDGKPTTGNTPKDTVIVFTFDAVVNKINSSKEPLNGAGFTLYKKVNSTWNKVGDEITGQTTFTFHGLDEGSYKLEETTVPPGYNKAKDIEFSIEAVYDADGSLKELKSDNTIFKATLNITTGKVEADVVNNSGSILPETGGIGTTIFYLLGGLLMIVAVVLLVTKRRMSSEK
ncbi:MAG: isopeptide-forming domain-containing fimbrial protein [Lachnospiraceae bacterium]|nr:isopeptide-forming domain-containing fimbrial protein [Lachnospiraceae bacterium]